MHSMNNNENVGVLLIDEEFVPVLTENECETIKPIMKEFLEGYIENNDIPVEVWLEKKIQEQLPDRNSEEIQSMVSEILTTLEKNGANKESLTEAIKNGRDKESWFASEMKEATSAMSVQEAVQYLNELDKALLSANNSLNHTITTQAGVINQNPRLDGFIAEQYHAQTFNLNAEAKGSPYRAKVLEPNGNRYAKNSVDIVIVDGNGKTVKRYQSKYCKDANATARAFENGDYRGQQKLVPEEQVSQINKKATSVIEADGVSSNPLSKSEAERMRDEAQSGRGNELNWNEYKETDVAVEIGKQAGYAALQGAAVSMGFDIAQRLWNGEEIEGKEVVDTALAGGADVGVKAALAGAIKVCAEKDVIRMIPKGTPAETISNIAFVTVENAKVLRGMAKGNLTVEEGIEKIEQTTMSTLVGLKTMGTGAFLGGTIGMVFGPVGAVIGGFAGNTVGYMAGSKIGKGVAKSFQTVRKHVGQRMKNKKNKLKEWGRNIWARVTT